MQQQHNEFEPSNLFRMLTTLLLLALLLEWLFPWLDAGEWRMLFHPQYLIWMTVIILAIGLLRPRLYLFVSAGVSLLLISLYLLFRSEEQYIGEWLINFIPSLISNLSEMMEFGIAVMSDEFRTMLLFTGWLLLAPALQSVIWQYHFSLALVAATLAYLLMLHTVLGFDIWLGLLRVIGVSLLLIAVTTGQKLKRYMPLTSGSKLFLYRWISVTVLTAIIVSGGYLLSENKEKQSEPIAWAELFTKSVADELAAWSQQSSGVPLKNVTSSSFRNNSVAYAGYDLNDSRLGAKMSKNADGVVFYGWSSEKSYWRGESKSTYTGKGWVDQEETLMLHKTADDVDTALAELDSREISEQILQTVTFKEPTAGMPLLQGGIKGVVLQLEASNPDRQLSSYIVEPATGAIYPPTTDAEVKSYTLMTELPIKQADLQAELNKPTESLAERAWEVDMLSEYLQLPEDLPERVIALAAEVAGGGLTSRYEQVKAIEKYLQTSYTYSLNSKLPDDSEDFVDHFLFEQKQGYCVHFSTAMVVMLRSQDIPARWVKGYQSGKPVEQRISDGVTETLYEVRQNDAHAWVEVYFPEVGWVPFDPTPHDTASDNQLSASLAPFNKLHDQLLTTLKKWSSGLTLNQWLWLTAVSFALLVGWLTLLISWPALKRKLYLRNYTAAYQQLEKRISSLAQVIGAANLPVRSSKQLTWNKQTQVRVSKLQQRLQASLEWLAEDLLSKWERKLGITDSSSLWRTWRQRINPIVHYWSNSEAEQAQNLQQLNRFISALEQLQYSNHPVALTPQELKATVLALHKSSLYKVKRKNLPATWTSESEKLSKQEEY